MNSFYRFRKVKNGFAHGVMIFCGLLACVPMILILYQCIKRGLPALSIEFFTSLPKSASEGGGGLKHSILGTTLLVGITAIFSIPVSLILGLLLSEYRTHRMARMAQFSIDLLSAIPSILIGVFIYGLVVVPMGGFSLFAGVLALTLIFIPVMSKASQEIFSLVPREIRESGMALGLSKPRVLISILVPGVKNGLVRSALLSVARVSGESAPLLFTALNSNFVSASLTRPISSLPVQIYTYAQTPFVEWQNAAWAGACVLIGITGLTQLLVRGIGRNK